MEDIKSEYEEWDETDIARLFRSVERYWKVWVIRLSQTFAKAVLTGTKKRGRNRQLMMLLMP